MLSKGWYAIRILVCHALKGSDDYRIVERTRKRVRVIEMLASGGDFQILCTEEM